MSDLSAALRDEVMRAFIEAPRDSIRYPPRMEASQAVRERERRLASRPWHWGLEHRLYVLRAWRWLAWSRQRHPPAPAIDRLAIHAPSCRCRSSTPRPCPAFHRSGCPTTGTFSPAGARRMAEMVAERLPKAAVVP